MNLGMFDRFCPSLNGREQLEERVYLNKFDRNRERYVIPMHRKNFWTNKWMQELRKNFCRLQAQHCDLSAQYRRGWGSLKRKRGLTLCCNCRRMGHLAKEFSGTDPICLCCKVIGHEVEDCPRMIAKVEKINTRQENSEESQEAKRMLGNHKEKELETMLVQLKKVMDDHRDIILPEILKEKQRIVTRIEDFDIDCVLVPSLGRIGLFEGNMITLCGRFTNIPMIAHETSTEEEF
jgi:hypothetical protein